MNDLEEYLKYLINIANTVESLNEKHSKRTTDSSIISILSNFCEITTYLKNRRKISTLTDVNSEDKVQDLIYIILKPFFPDLTYEDPGHKISNQYSIKDFYLPSKKTIIEAKYIDKKDDEKRILKEINVDIMNYSDDERCDTIIFFIYDPNQFIIDKYNFMKGIKHEKGSFKRSGREVLVDVLIKPS